MVHAFDYQKRSIINAQNYTLCRLGGGGGGGGGVGL